MAAPATTQATASGLTAIQASSAAGKAASAAGWAQNEETDSVDAHEKAATPPGTRPGRAHGWPPVPGQPFPKCLPPTTTTARPARNSADGPSRPRASSAGHPRHHAPRHGQRGEQRQDGEDQHRSGHHERRHGGTGGVRPGPLPADGELRPHGAADTEEDGCATGERGEAGAGLGRGLGRAPAQPGVREPGHDPAPDHVRRPRPRPRALAEVGDQEFGELLAVAGPPRLRVPAEQPRGPLCRRVRGGRVGGAHAQAPVSGQAAQPEVGDTPLRVEVGPQRHRAHRREPVGATAVLTLDRLDQPLRLEAGERLIQRAGRQPDAGEGLDVLGQGIAVLGAVREAGEDERGRSGVAAEPGERLRGVRLRFAPGIFSGHERHRISVTDLSATDTEPRRDQPVSLAASRHTSSARGVSPSNAACTVAQVRSASRGAAPHGTARASRPSVMSRRRSSISPSV